MDVKSQLPERFVRHDGFLDFRKLREVSNLKIKVAFLGVDTSTLSRKINQASLNSSDTFNSLFSNLSSLNILKLFNTAVYIFELSLEGSSLIQKALFDHALVLIQITRMTLNKISDLVDIEVSRMNRLNDFISVSLDFFLSLRVFIQELHPFHDVIVIIDDFRTFLSLNQLEIIVSSDKLNSSSSFLSENGLNFTHISDNGSRYLVVDILTNFVQHSGYVVLTFFHQFVVQSLAFDKEHAHSNFERHFSSDLFDSSFVLVNSFLEFLTIIRLLLEEFGYSFSLRDEIGVFIVDVDDLAGDLKVLHNDFFNILHSSLDDFIIRLNVPEVGLLGVAETQIRPGDLVDLLNHEGDDANQTLEYFHLVFTEFYILSINLQLESDKSLLKFFIRAVFAADDILRAGIGVFWLLESFVEVHIFSNGTSDKVSNLVRHKSSYRVAEVLSLVFVEVIEFFS